MALKRRGPGRPPSRPLKAILNMSFEFTGKSVTDILSIHGELKEKAEQLGATVVTHVHFDPPIDSTKI